MTTKQQIQIDRPATYFHSMLGRNIEVIVRRVDRRGYFWVEMPNGELRRVQAMYVSC